MNSPVSLWLRIVAWLAVAIWAGAIYYCSSLTGTQIAHLGIHLWDKLEHFSAFTAGGVLLSLALRWSVTWPWKSVARFAIVALVIYGALDEFHQLFTPNRSGADPFDWLADSLGALTGVALFLAIYARFSRTHPAAPAGA